MTRAAVLVGAVISAHGVNGEVKVKSFTADPLALGHYGPLATEQGQLLDIASSRQLQSGELIIRFCRIDSRNDAERLSGAGLYVPRASLPEPGAGEYYHVDLIDLRAERSDGAEIGRISAVLNFGAGDILEITRRDGSTELVPFTSGYVPMVDFAAGRVVVDLPSTPYRQS